MNLNDQIVFCMVTSPSILFQVFPGLGSSKRVPQSYTVWESCTYVSGWYSEILFFYIETEDFQSLDFV